MQNKTKFLIQSLSHNDKTMVFSDFSRLWSKGGGHFSIALSKGAKTTTPIWNLHSDAHDFDIPSGFIHGPRLEARKVFSSNVAHLSLVFLCISQMHFHGAYFSNDDIWNKDPSHYLPSAHLVWSFIGQDILNSDIGNYFQGIHIRLPLDYGVPQV
jgi:photosystem I P700 chlorophyll a apoprotein A1